MTTQEIYEKLHAIDVIAELETKPGVWYIENFIDEYRLKPTSYYPTLKEAVESLAESSNWFGPKGTGNIVYQEFGLGGNIIDIYSGKSSIKDNGDIVFEWGKVWV